MSSASKEYRTWQRINRRCHDASHHRYPWYGERGIKVCARWRNSFANFAADMGNAPTPSHTIDRMDNDGDYEPGNCRWATWLEQAQNRSSNVRLTHAGRTQTVAEWAREKGMDRRVLWKRINVFGWKPGRAIETPVAPRKKRAEPDRRMAA